MKNLLVYVCIALNLIVTAFSIISSSGKSIKGFAVKGSAFADFISKRHFMVDGSRYEVLKPGLFVKKLNKADYIVWRENPRVIQEYYTKLYIGH